MDKHLVLLLLLAVGLAPKLPAQSNQLLDRIMAEDELRFGSALYLVVSAGSAIYRTDEFDIAAALRRVRHRITIQTYDPITLGQYAFVLQEFFDLPEGMWYRLLSGPRYAARDLAHAEIIQGRAYPAMPLSGRRAVHILGRALMHMEGNL